MTVAVMTVTVLMMVMMNMMMMTMLVVMMMTATWATPWQNKTKASISCLQTFREDNEVENKNFSHLIVLRSQLSFLPGVWNWSGPVRCRGSTFMPAPGVGQCSLCSVCNLQALICLAAELRTQELGTWVIWVLSSPRTLRGDKTSPVLHPFNPIPHKSTKTLWKRAN